MSILVEVPADSLFDNFRIYNPKIHFDFKGYDPQSVEGKVKRNLLNEFEEEYEKSQKEQQEKAEKRLKEEKLKEDLKTKQQLLEKIQKSFGIKLSEMPREPLQNITNYDASRTVHHPSRPPKDPSRPPVSPGEAMNQGEVFHQELLKSNFLVNGHPRPQRKRNNSETRKDFSLNSGGGYSRGNLQEKMSRSMDVREDDFPQKKKVGFEDFLKNLKKYSFVAYAKKKLRQSGIYNPLPENCTTQKYEADDTKYRKLQSFINQCNLEHLRQTGTSRSGTEFELMSTKGGGLQTKRELCGIIHEDKHNKTASTHNPGSTSRLKQITTCRGTRLECEAICEESYIGEESIRATKTGRTNDMSISSKRVKRITTDPSISFCSKNLNMSSLLPLMRRQNCGESPMRLAGDSSRFDHGARLASQKDLFLQKKAKSRARGMSINQEGNTSCNALNGSIQMDTILRSQRLLPKPPAQTTIGTLGMPHRSDTLERHPMAHHQSTSSQAQNLPVFYMPQSLLKKLKSFSKRPKPAPVVSS